MTAGLRSRRWLIAALSVPCGLCAGFAAKARADELVYACGPYPNNVFVEADAFGMEEQETCGQSAGRMIIQSSGGGKKGADAYWEAQTPPGLLIDQSSVGAMSVENVNEGSPYGGGFF